MADRVRIAIVDSYPIFRKGLVDTISGSRRVVVAEGETTEDVLRIVAELDLDILIMDPSISAYSMGIIEKLLNENAGLKIIALTASDDEADVAEALRCGIHGYILKGVTGTELLSAIDNIVAGESYVTPTLGSRMLMKAKSKQGFTYIAAAADLTHHDRWVLRRLAKGLNNRQIAGELGINVRTAKYYLSQLFKKLGVRSRLEAVLKAQKMGLGLPYREDL